MRRISRKVTAGNTVIGGGAPITVQSMLSVPASDIHSSVQQAIRLESAGCDIIRAAVPRIEDVPLISAIKDNVKCPIVADIHFDYRIALECAKAGVDKIRINPGNIGSPDRIKAVADCCKERGIPIRIGINSGSLEKDILEKYGSPTAEALCESALKNAAMLEEYGFYDIVISIKSSSAKTTYDANMLLAQSCDYPLHIGVTEAGTANKGVVKSSAAMGGLLLAGIGDTVRVSLTAQPEEEVKTAIKLLESVGERKSGVNIISCPTCGRTKINLIGIAERVGELLENCDKKITVAVMGCVVNGPGEAKEADIGLAGGDGCGIIFKKGQIVRRLPENELIDGLMSEIKKL